MMNEHSKHIAIVGLGQMGSRYAQRFLDHGFTVTVWNRSAERAQPLAAAGARVATSIADCVRAADTIVAALENAAAFSGSLLSPEALAEMRSTHLIIDTSTVHPASAREASAKLGERGARYLDAPVSGGTRGAAQGTLTILVGGAPADFERAAPILRTLGTPHLLGPTGAGEIAKLVNQTIVAVTIGAAAEGLFLAERAGIDPAQLLSALQGGFADSRILREHGERMVTRNFAPGASNRVFLKDLNAITALARDTSTTLPLTQAQRDAYAKLLDAGLGEQDHSSYFNYLKLLDGNR